MKKNTYLAIIIYIVNLFTCFSQETFKTMFYNLLNFPLENAVPNRIQDLNFILNEYRPDLFMVCELNNIDGANTILDVLQSINPNYQSVIFELNTSDDAISDQNDLQNLVYYDSSKFILESQAIVTTIFRDFNHYRFKINSIAQSTNPVYLDVIVCHLKASSGTENQAYRLEMVNDLVGYLDTFSAESNVILAGDFNVYTNSEPAFQELIDPTNTIVFTDPANRIGSWHNNINYVDVMTQSTRTQTGLGGTTGGFDDRFDFIMTSEYMTDNTELKYISNSYKVFGNNSNPLCFNQAINSEDCSGSEYSATIRDALHNFSDHLPVTLLLETNQTLSVKDYIYNDSISFIGSNIISNELQLQINQLTIAFTQLYIYNNIGQLVNTIEINNNTTIKIDTSSLTNGMYYITSNNLYTKPLKFIITH